MCKRLRRTVHTEWCLRNLPCMLWVITNGPDCPEASYMLCSNDVQQDHTYYLTLLIFFLNVELKKKKMSSKIHLSFFFFFYLASPMYPWPPHVFCGYLEIPVLSQYWGEFGLCFMFSGMCGLCISRQNKDEPKVVAYPVHLVIECVQLHVWVYDNKRFHSWGLWSHKQNVKIVQHLFEEELTIPT